MKSLSRHLLRPLREQSASQIAEAAVILPLLFMLLLSIYWFGRAYTISGTINHAAREGVMAAAQPFCANCVSACAWQGSSLVCDKAVSDTVTQALQAANLDPTQARPFPPSPTPPACPGVVPQGACSTVSSGEFTICRNVVLDQTSNAPACGMIVSFQYPYQFNVPFLSVSSQTILLTAAAEVQGEN